MTGGELIKNVFLVVACLLIIVALGSIPFVGRKDKAKALPDTASKEKSILEGADTLLLVNASVAELIDFIDMREPPPEFETAPGFELLSITGEKVSLEQYRGKTVLLGFWTTW